MNYINYLSEIAVGMFAVTAVELLRMLKSFLIAAIAFAIAIIAIASMIACAITIVLVIGLAKAKKVAEDHQIETENILPKLILTQGSIATQEAEDYWTQEKDAQTQPIKSFNAITGMVAPMALLPGAIETNIETIVLVIGLAKAKKVAEDHQIETENILPKLILTQGSIATQEAEDYWTQEKDAQTQPIKSFNAITGMVAPMALLPGAIETNIEGIISKPKEKKANKTSNKTWKTTTKKEEITTSQLESRTIAELKKLIEEHNQKAQIKIKFTSKTKKSALVAALAATA